MVVTNRLPGPLRRQQLIDVAVEVFAARGFDRTSMDDVAEAAGVTKPVLYQHFASKRDLYLALLDDVGSQLLDAIAAATAVARTPRDQVEAGFSAYFSFVQDRQNAFRLLFGGGEHSDPGFSDAVTRVEQTIGEAIAELIEADIDDDHRRLLANGIVGLAEGTARYWLSHSLALEPAVVARRIADLAYAGLRAVHR